MALHVLYEDNHLLAVAKPPGLATQGAAAGRASLVALAKDYLRRKYRKPGNVYLGVVSRLDAPVSGVVIFARTSKAAARLNEQFRKRTVKKVYWALVEGLLEPAAAECIDWVAKDEPGQRMVIVPPPRGIRSSKTGEPSAAGRGKPAAKPQEARLSYRRLKALGGVSLVEITLETGRKHQIRLQLASRGHPLVGDRKYGSQRTFPSGIALHCRRLVIEHPVKKTPVQLVAPVPAAWRALKK